MKGLRHPASVFKVRIRRATGSNGGWWACYVTDCAPTTDGCRQRPVPYIRGAYGGTPGMAYLNLTRSKA